MLGSFDKNRPNSSKPEWLMGNKKGTRKSQRTRGFLFSSLFERGLFLAARNGRDRRGILLMPGTLCLLLYTSLYYGETRSISKVYSTPPIIALWNA